MLFKLKKAGRAIDTRSKTVCVCSIFRTSDPMFDLFHRLGCG